MLHLLRRSLSLGSWRLARKVASVARHEGPAAVVRRALGRHATRIGGAEYRRWCERHTRLNTEDRRSIRAHIASLKHTPTFSIITPVYNVDGKWLRATVESVRHQLYPHWQLCLVDDASTKLETRAVLDEVDGSDPRIVVVRRSTNAHISRASNDGLKVATGELIALLDHDDILAEHALYMAAVAVNNHPDAGLIYSDEDKIDTRDRRFDPYFKPDWDPDLFLSQNYVSHLGIYRRELVREVGGFREGLEGSQDYDLALRVSERLAPSQIVHIPEVLYHWRTVPGSTALDVGEKNYAVTAATRAISDALERRAVSASVEPAPISPGYHRVRYSVGNEHPRVAIIIPTRDRVNLLQQAIDSITQRSTYPAYEIVVVDNRSQAPDSHAYFATLRAKPNVRVEPYDAEFNYSAINNHAVRLTSTPVVALLNNDIEVITPDWLEEMVSHAIRPAIGCVGSMLYYPDARIQHAGVVLGIHGVAGHIHRLMRRGSPGYFSRAGLVQDFSVVTAACLVVRRAVYDEVAGLDESLRVAFNDVDFCLRVRGRGYRNLWTPYAELYHHESATRGSDASPENRERFAAEIAFMQERWGASLRADPAYNPNLTLSGLYFGLADSPRVTKPWRDPSRSR